MTEEAKQDDSQQYIEGTPEYQAAYDEAMRKLENPDAKSDEDDQPKDEPSDEPKDEPKDEEPSKTDDDTSEESEPAAKPDETAAKLAELQAQLASTGKALQDTQRWGHKLAGQLKEVKRKLKESSVKERPKLLDEAQGLEDAIRFVNQQSADADDDDDEDLNPPDINNQGGDKHWVDIVGTALPDLDKMLADPEFDKQAQALRDQHKSEWGNPLKAISHLTELRTQYLTQKAVAAAEKAAATKAQDAQRKKDEMRIPGGNSASRSERGKQKDLVNDAGAVWDMPADQFEKMQRKAKGF